MCIRDRVHPVPVEVNSVLYNTQLGEHQTGYINANAADFGSAFEDTGDALHHSIYGLFRPLLHPSHSIITVKDLTTLIYQNTGDLGTTDINADCKVLTVHFPLKKT
jgi:hypothetical protein